MPATDTASVPRRRVVIIGGGFGGLAAARKLGGASADVTLVDRQNYFLFQPLVYQVATGSLSPVEIATPLRAAVRGTRNVGVILGEAVGFDLESREALVQELPNGERRRRLPYDMLVVAGGCRYSYFGHDEWEVFAPELKTLAGALELRDRILLAFEAAEVEPDPAARVAWLTFIVVGAGPTGVEMAGQIAELARDVLPKEYRDVDTRTARVLLVEAGSRVLGAFGERLARSAERQLRSLGVTPLLNSTVVGVDADGADVELYGKRFRIPSRTKVWSAGVAASGLATLLASASGAEMDRAGRILVESDLTVGGHRDVFAIGDMAAVRGHPLHGVAPVAMQQGRHVARLILTETRTPFRYRDKGELATIGRARAVGVIKGVPVTGFVAWLAWLGIHLAYLTGVQNRLVVMTRWIFAYLTRGRSARLITRTATPTSNADRTSGSAVWPQEERAA